MMVNKERQDFSFTGSDGLQIACYRWPHAGRATGILQMSHAFGSNALHFARLATVMSDAGFEVYASDHRGCGRTAKDLRSLGDFGGIAGWKATVADVVLLNKIAISENAGLPLIVLGQGIGSFIVQQFLLDHSELVAGAILSGSAALDQLVAAFKSGELESLNAAFEPARTPLDWLSRDNIAVDAFLNDPSCSFGFGETTLEALAHAAPRLSDPKELAGIRSKLPIYLLAGDQDPINRQLEWVKLLASRYRTAGVFDVTEQYYPGGRHELLHETNWEEVQKDLLRWCRRVCDSPNRNRVEVS